MRAVLSLLGLLSFVLAGCVDKQQRLPEYDPIRGGAPLPERGSARPEADAINRTKPAPLPSGEMSSTAALTMRSSGPSAAVKLGSPRPIEKGNAPGTLLSSPLPAKLSYEEAQAKLQARGVNWQVLKRVGGDRWFFQCTIPDPRDPYTQLNFEVTAPGRGGVAAMEAVLRQIEETMKASPAVLTGAEPG